MQEHYSIDFLEKMELELNIKGGWEVEQYP